MGALRRGLPATAPELLMKSRLRFLPVVLGLLLLAPSSQSALRRYNVPPSPEAAAARAGLPEGCSEPAGPTWRAAVGRLRWVAYSSPNPMTRPGHYQPTAATIQLDLQALRAAGFDALVTYASGGVMGREFPGIAASLGFKGLILGIWNPRNAGEVRNALQAADATSIVLGYVVGNEGLYERARRPYALGEVCRAISELRQASGLPATTSEQYADYVNHPELMLVGDWLFPIAHPYWHANNDAVNAVAWQENRFAEMSNLTDRYVFFKEVGLPTSGAFGLDEQNHAGYYHALEKTAVQFVYFEAFDQPSKTGSGVEPHWGLFHADRRPKLAAWNLIGARPLTSIGMYDGWSRGCANGSDSVCAVEDAGELVNLGAGREHRRYRAGLVFDTDAIPEQALITALKLRVRAQGVEGRDPLKGGRQIRVQACPVSFGPLPGLAPNDFDSGAACAQMGVFRPTAVHGWYILEFDASAFAALNRSGLTKLLLSVVGDDRLRPGHIRLFSGEAAPENRPELVVRYEMP
jgi:exo-beta-1,3-glucanase (GH17 family)